MAEDESGFERSDDDAPTRRGSSSVVPPPKEILGGRYRIEAFLGEGAAGRVYRAHDLELDEPVALKRLTSVTSGATEMLRNEVRLARRVTHENVVRVHDLGVERDGSVYLTMQLVEGRSLSSILRGGPLPRDEAATLAIQICEGLDAAHRAGVVHADLKPGNVLVEERGPRRTALISDFGISRALVETQASIVAGTPVYMAPEQRAPGPIDVRADIYALGIVVFEILTAERLLAREVDPSSPGVEARIRAALPADVAALVIAALSSDPDRRPASACVVASALATCAVELGATDPTPQVAKKPPRRLAVAPLGQIGDGDDRHIGLGIAEELARLLAAIPELSVLGTRSLVEAASPRDAALSLGADLVLEGAVQRLGARVRVTIAIVDVRSGIQVWRDRFDGAITDVFAFQEEIAMRICEALRIRWIDVDTVRAVKPEAVDLYFRARSHLLRGDAADPLSAVTMLERCLELAPELSPAIALHAVSCVSAWFLPSRAHERDWGEASRAAAARALERAPGLAETHVAAGLVAAQDGDVEATVRALRRALDLAPTHADAHTFLGGYQLEAGRTRDGLAHLELALRLSPDAWRPSLFVARHYALRGDRSRVPNIDSMTGNARFAAVQMRIRVASWYGDTAELERCAAAARTSTLLEEGALLGALCDVVLGKVSPEEADRMFEAMPSDRLSVRIRTYNHQIMAEVHAARGAIDRAARHLRAAADHALVDVEWLERCPPIQALRTHPVWPAVEGATRNRAKALLAG